MAITSISRIQHRRGLRADLPVNLAEGEFGWCLDTRELFIGNSQAYGLNSQILTEYSNNDQIIKHQYVGPTGIPAVTNLPNLPPTLRPLGSKLDERVSVKDYGAIGDGVADDSAAINLAISDRYKTAVTNGRSPKMALVALYFPAGRYRITSPIIILPYVNIIGDGPANTEIYMDNVASSYVATTGDSLGQTDVNIGANSATAPSKISISHITLTQSNKTGDVLVLWRSSNIDLFHVALAGSYTQGDGSSNASASLRVRSNGGLLPCSQINATNCQFTNSVYGVAPANINDYCNAVSLVGCYFTYCYTAILTNANTNNIKTSSSEFQYIDGFAINAVGSNGITSIGNNYSNVAQITGPFYIYWNNSTQNCSSVSDTFDVSFSTSIFDGNHGYNLIVNAQGASISNQNPFGPVLLSNNQSSPSLSGISFDLTKATAITINYTVTRGSLSRIGKIEIITNGVIAGLSDVGTDLLGSTGISWSYSIAGGYINLLYTSTNTGNNAFMKYLQTTWLA
jgi:hypothetical protein